MGSWYFIAWTLFFTLQVKFSSAEFNIVCIIIIKCLLNVQKYCRICKFIISYLNTEISDIYILRSKDIGHLNTDVANLTLKSVVYLDVRHLYSDFANQIADVRHLYTEIERYRSSKYGDRKSNAQICCLSRFRWPLAK